MVPLPVLPATLDIDNRRQKSEGANSRIKGSGRSKLSNFILDVGGETRDDATDREERERIKWLDGHIDGAGEGFGLLSEEEVMLMIVVLVILNASKSSYIIGIHGPFYISIYSMLS